MCGTVEGRATGRGVRVWSQRPRRRHLSENQQPQTKVRRRLMRMLEYNEMMSILFVSQQPVAPKLVEGGSTLSLSTVRGAASKNIRPDEVRRAETDPAR